MRRVAGKVSLTFFRGILCEGDNPRGMMLIYELVWILGEVEELSLAYLAGQNIIFY